MKNNLLLVLVFMSGAVFGGGGLYFWQQAHPKELPLCAARSADTQLLLTQLEEAGLPDDLKAAQEETVTLKTSAEIPSQLVRADLPDDVVLGVKPAEPAEGDEKSSGVILDEAQTAVVLRAQKPAERAADNTSITMLEAPVEVRRIQTLDDYKSFKQQARGKYPEVDFTKEEVLVLESQSNLPDKAFEIADVVQDGNSLTVRYRVNLFGLDQKTNTHSAAKVPKVVGPVVLEQVL